MYIYVIFLKDQISQKNLCNFQNIAEIFAKFSNSDKLKLYSEELEKIYENFKIRFQDIFGMEGVINLYNNPLTCSIGNFPENMKTELSGFVFLERYLPNKIWLQQRHYFEYLFNLFHYIYLLSNIFSNVSNQKETP